MQWKFVIQRCYRIFLKDAVFEKNSFDLEQRSLLPHVFIVDWTCERVSDVAFWDYIRYMDI